MYGLTPVIHQEGPTRGEHVCPHPAGSPGPLPNLREWAVAPLTERECVTYILKTIRLFMTIKGLIILERKLKREPSLIFVTTQYKHITRKTMCPFQVVFTFDSLVTLNEIEIIAVPYLGPVMIPLEVIDPFV